MVQWLKDRWPDINHRAQNDAAFRLAYSYGQLHVAQWLKAEYPDINHFALDNFAFRAARFRRYFRVAKWLKSLDSNKS